MCMRRGRAEGEGERESQADSTLGVEPNAGPHTGLNPTTLGSLPEPKLIVKHSID